MNPFIPNIKRLSSSGKWQHLKGLLWLKGILADVCFSKLHECPVALKTLTPIKISTLRFWDIWALLSCWIVIFASKQLNKTHFRMGLLKLKSGPLYVEVKSVLTINVVHWSNTIHWVRCIVRENRVLFFTGLFHQSCTKMHFSWDTDA